MANFPIHFPATQAMIPLVFTLAGVVQPPPAGGVATSSDPIVAEVDLAIDGGSVTIRAKSTGTVNIHYSNSMVSGLAADLMVDVTVEPAPPVFPDAVMFDVDHAVVT